MRRDSKRHPVVHALFAGAVLLIPAMPWAADAPAQADARVLFLQNCASCHRADGHGSPGAVPDLHEYLGQFAEHPQARAFLARAPNAAAAPITDAELASVLNWIVTSMNATQVDEGFEPYTAAEIARYRRNPLLDVETERRRLIDLVHGARGGAGAAVP